MVNHEGEEAMEKAVQDTWKQQGVAGTVQGCPVPVHSGDVVVTDAMVAVWNKGNKGFGDERAGIAAVLATILNEPFTQEELERALSSLPKGTSDSLPGMAMRVLRARLLNRNSKRDGELRSIRGRGGMFSSDEMNKRLDAAYLAGQKNPTS